MMTYATSSPAATTGGGQGNNNIPVSSRASPAAQPSLVLASVLPFLIAPTF